ncbi:hypothetical protein GCM10017673_28860 [Streptosporangium violaceochromogenes]|nr:hypothetical protein GCM10017673_28860 [Streptosporangium violaceochromogenes]
MNSPLPVTDREATITATAPRRKPNEERRDMGDHEGKPKPPAGPFEIPEADEYQSDGRPPPGQHEKPSPKK